MIVLEKEVALRFCFWEDLAIALLIERALADLFVCIKIYLIQPPIRHTSRFIVDGSRDTLNEDNEIHQCLVRRLTRKRKTL